MANSSKTQIVLDHTGQQNTGDSEACFHQNDGTGVMDEHDGRIGVKDDHDDHIGVKDEHADRIGVKDERNDGIGVKDESNVQCCNTSGDSYTLLWRRGVHLDHQHSDDPTTADEISNISLDDLEVFEDVASEFEDGEISPGALCRICYGSSDDEILLHPCHCSGSVQYSHESCLMTWLKSGATTCEICQFPYRFQKFVTPWKERTHPNITLWHLGWVLKELVVLDWFHFLETVFICISLVVINRMSSFDLVYQFALIGLVELLYYTLNIFSCFFLLYHGRWARLNMKVIVLNYDDEHPVVKMGIFYRLLDSYSSLLKRNKRLKQVVDQINEAEGED